MFTKITTVRLAMTYSLQEGCILFKALSKNRPEATYYEVLSMMVADVDKLQVTLFQSELVIKLFLRRIHKPLCLRR
jgi:hypothetical protein